MDSLQSVLLEPISDSTKVMILNRIAWNYVFNNFDSAKLYFKRAIKAANESENVFVKAYTQLNLGSFHTINENYTGGLNCYLSCLYLSENNDLTKLMPAIWGNMGNLYSLQKEYDKSLLYYKKRLGIARKNNSKGNLVRNMSNIGSAYVNLGYYDSADLFLSEAEVIAEAENMDMSMIYHNRGKLYQNDSNWHEAIKYYKKSVNVKKKNKVEGQLPSTYNGLGGVYMALGYIDSAKFYYNKAYNIALKFNFYSDARNSISHLSRIKAEEEDYEEAYLLSEKLITLADSIKSNSNKKEIASIEFYHNMEIEQLRNDIEEQRSDLMRVVIVILTLLIITIMAVLILSVMMYLRKKKANIVLVKRVQEKTLELEKKNKILEKHAFDLSHTIKSPITTILGIINLLDYDQKAEEQTECLTKLKGVSENLDSVLSEKASTIDNT